MSGQEWRQTRSLSSRNLVFTRCVEPLYSTPPDLAYSTAQALSAFHFWERAGPQIRCCPVHGFPSSGLKYVEVRCDGSTSLETSSLVDAKIPRLREALCEVRSAGLSYASPSREGGCSSWLGGGPSICEEELYGSGVESRKSRAGKGARLSHPPGYDSAD